MSTDGPLRHRQGLKNVAIFLLVLAILSLFGAVAFASVRYLVLTAVFGLGATFAFVALRSDRR